MKLPNIDPSLCEEQLKEFESEKKNLAIHRREAQAIISSEMPKQARVLVLDTSQGCFDPQNVGDAEFVKYVVEEQFSGGPISHAETFRTVMGFAKTDPRYLVWDIAKEPNKNLPNLSQIDAFIVTGGPAMPSQLLPGNETENTPWLKKTVATLQALTEHKVAGLAICLGHQLWNHTQGAFVGRLKPQREFGTVKMKLTEAGQKLKLFQNVGDANGEFIVSASHSESVIVPPPYPGMEVLATNAYSPFQSAAFPLTKGQSVAEADAEDNLVVSIQNHPEMLGSCLEVLRRTREKAILSEGLDLHHMVFRDTPKARNVFLNFLHMIARRAQQRT